MVQLRSVEAAGDWMVGPWHRILAHLALAEPHVSQEFADDAGIAHCPSGARFEVTLRRPMFVIGPSHTGVVQGGVRHQIVDQDIREVKVVATFDHAVTRQCEHTRRATTATIVVPESRPLPFRKTRFNYRAPTSIAQNGPNQIAGDASEEPKNLRIARGSVTPAVAVALDKFGVVRRVGMGDEKATWPRFVSTHHVRGCGECHGDQVVTARGFTDGGQRVDDAECAVCDVMSPWRREPHGPVDSERCGLGGREIRRHGDYCQIKVTRAQCAQSDTCISH